jgi:hypothetical protein
MKKWIRVYLELVAIVESLEWTGRIVFVMRSSCDCETTKTRVHWPENAERGTF